MTLDDQTIERFSRQIILPEVGPRGQERLAACRVLCVGLEPAATTAALYIAAAGVGRLGLADDRPVSQQDVKTTFALRAADVGHPRPRVAAAAIERVGGPTRCHTYNAPAVALAEQDWDLIVCGAREDHQAAACNRAAIASATALVVLRNGPTGGWVAGFAGHSAAYPCWDCVSPALPALEPAPDSVIRTGLLGAIAAVESLKLVLSVGVSLCGRRLVHEPGGPGIHPAPIVKAPDCPTCQRPGNIRRTART